jgi:hypothetical protein
MSLGIFGLLLVGLVVALCWKGKARVITTAIVSVLLGLVIAGSDGPLAQVATSAVSGLRDGLDGMGTAVSEAMFGGEHR